MEDRLVDLLAPLTPEWEDAGTDEENADKSADRHARTQEKFRKKLRAGNWKTVWSNCRWKRAIHRCRCFPTWAWSRWISIFSRCSKRSCPSKARNERSRLATPARSCLEQEIEGLMDKDAVHEEAIALGGRERNYFRRRDRQNLRRRRGSSHADVSRQGVQRDLLPIVEGTTVQTRYGTVNTSHILFIAAGAFHRTKPSDLMPELQGRFPIRVELTDLTRDDFIRILTEPTSSLTKQYEALLATDSVTLQFTKDGLESMADIAYQVNQSTQNIGARRLYTIMERLLEEISFEAPDMKKTTVKIDAAYVRATEGSRRKQRPQPLHPVRPIPPLPVLAVWWDVCSQPLFSQEIRRPSMIRKHKTLALAALLSVSVICALGAGRTADQKSPDKDKADQAVADEFIGVWHTTSATTSFLIEIKPDGEALFVLIQGGTHGIDDVSWKPLPGGLLVKRHSPDFDFGKAGTKTKPASKWNRFPPE